MLAKKLTDDDIGAILVCIDAENKLKSLRLNFIDIVGHGLEPLREATTLEEIVFSMDTKQLSKSAVLPIIESIIDTEGSSLFKKWYDFDNKCENTNGDPPLVLPTEWKEGKARYEQPLNGFLSKVNQMLIKESKCRAECHPERQKNGGTNSGHMACLTCFATYCSDCDGNIYSVLKCDKCDLTLCGWCEQDFAICRECNSTFCSVCAEKDDVDAAKQCENCTGYATPICFGCVSSDNEDCERCLGLFFPQLKARNEELGNEIGGLCEENDTHKAEINRLRKEVDDLRKQLSEGLGILG